MNEKNKKRSSDIYNNLSKLFETFSNFSLINNRRIFFFNFSNNILVYNFFSNIFHYFLNFSKTRNKIEKKYPLERIRILKLR